MLHLYRLINCGQGVQAFCWLPSIYIKPSNHPLPAASRASPFGSFAIAGNSASTKQNWSFLLPAVPFCPPCLPPMSFRNSPFSLIIPLFLQSPKPWVPLWYFLLLHPRVYWLVNTSSSSCRMAFRSLFFFLLLSGLLLNQTSTISIGLGGLFLHLSTIWVCPCVGSTHHPLCVFNLNAHCLSAMLHTASRHISLLPSLYLCLAQEFIVIIKKRTCNDWHCLKYQPKSGGWHSENPNSGCSYQAALSPHITQILEKWVPNGFNTDLACGSLYAPCVCCLLFPPLPIPSNPLLFPPPGPGFPSPIYKVGLKLHSLPNCSLSYFNSNSK